MRKDDDEESTIFDFEFQHSKLKKLHMEAQHYVEIRKDEADTLVDAQYESSLPILHILKLPLSHVAACLSQMRYRSRKAFSRTFLGRRKVVHDFEDSFSFSLILLLENPHFLFFDIFFFIHLIRIFFSSSSCFIQFFSHFDCRRK